MPIDEQYTKEGILKSNNSLNDRLSQAHAQIALKKEDINGELNEKLKKVLREQLPQGVDLFADYQTKFKAIDASNSVARLSLRREFDRNEAELFDEHRETLMKLFVDQKATE